MANEFKIKNGFFSEGSSNITGSLNVSAGITGSLLGTSSYATSTAAVAGTTNYIPKFTSGTTIGDSLIYDNGGNIGVGTLTAGVKLDTVGYVRDTKSRTAEQEPFTLATNWSGDVIEGAIDGSVSTWDLVSLDASGNWIQADNTNVKSTCMLGIYTGVDNLVLLEGHITVDDGSSGPNIQGLSMGIPIYIRDGGVGLMSTILPTTSNNYVRICGHAYYKSGGSITDAYIIKFRPSNDWVQL
jgi:hypothetical protein